MDYFRPTRNFSSFDDRRVQPICDFYLNECKIAPAFTLINYISVYFLHDKIMCCFRKYVSTLVDMFLVC